MLHSLRRRMNRHINIYAYIALIMMLAMAAGLALKMFHIGRSNMTVEVSQILSVNALAIVVLVMLLFSLIRIGLKDDYGKQAFFVMGVIVAVQLFADAIDWVVDGLPQFHTLNFALCTLLFLLDVIDARLIWTFLRETYDLHTMRSRKGDHIADAALLFGMAVVVINIFTGFVFSVDENGVFATGNFFLLYLMPSVVITLICVAAMRRVKATFLSKLILLSYLGLPICLVIATSGIESDFMLYYVFIFLMHVFAYSNLLVLREKQVTDQQASIAAAKNELDVARRIQLSMLPGNFDDVNSMGIDVYAHMETAKEVGGDFYDFFRIDEDRVCILIADVSGKGVPASLFMTIGKTLLHKAIRSEATLAEAVASAHASLCQQNDENLFITMWAGILDTKKHILTYTNAGHNPPLITRGSGMFEYLKDRHGLVLGCCLKPDAKYRQSEISFIAGDRLFLYTDGVTEAHDEKENLYGEDRLLEYLNTHREGDVRETVAGLFRDVRSFAGDAPQFDDITVLMLQEIWREG